MSFPNDQGTLARYIPQNAGTQQMEGSSFGFGEDESLKGVWTVLRKRKGQVGLFALTGLLLALLVCLLMGRQYAATTTVEVGKTDAAQTSLLRNAEPVVSGAEDLKTDIATHMAMLQSDSVLLAVVKELNLQKEAPFRYEPGILGSMTGLNARIESEKGLPLEQAPTTRDRILEIFARKLKVENLPDTRMIQLTYLSPNAKRSADVANAIVREYVTYEARSQSTTEAQDWLTGQLAELRTNVETSENRVAQFEQETGLNSLVLGSVGQGGGGGTTHVPALDKLDALNQQLTAAETNRLAKETIYHLTRTQNPEVVTGLTGSGLPGVDPSEIAVEGSKLQLLQSLRQQQSALQLSLAELSTKYGPKNPHILETQNQLASLDKQVATELRKINASAKDEFLLAAQNEAGIRSSFNQQQHEAGKLNVSAVRLQALTQEAAASRQLYDALYGKLKEVKIQAGLRATNIGVANPARPPSKPSRPNPPLYLAIGLAAGLFAGISSALVREHMDDTLTSPLQIHSSPMLPLLGSIPSSREQRQLSSGGDSGLTAPETSLLISAPRSPVAESYRALRTAITVSGDAGRLRSLLVTSGLLGEGKTSVAYNTAVAFALAGKNVLLVDADMRRPRMHDLFNVSRKPGLSDLLTGTSSLDQVLRKHEGPVSLSLIAAGSETATSAELLGSKQFDELLKVLTSKYDLVIFDSPPMLLVTDARVLSEKLDASLAVIRSGKTTRATMDALTAMLRSGSSRAVWLVLNAVDTKSIAYYEAYSQDGEGKYSNA